ncbi:TetR/AcrR family transcriptional regulator [Micromonospora sp. NPDC004336]
MPGRDPSPTPPVGRGPKVQAAVRAATLAELLDRGYAELTVDAVAQRAGVHKTTVYRRWKDRETLVVDALAEHFAAEIPVVDTGDVETDLHALARALVRSMAGPLGAAVQAATHSDAGRLPEIAEARRRLLADRFRRAEPLVRRAVERGELPVATDPVAVFEALAAPVHFRLLVTGEPVDDALADRTARIVLAAARAGELVSPAARAGRPAATDEPPPARKNRR